MDTTQETVILKIETEDVLYLLKEAMESEKQMTQLYVLVI